MAKSKNQRTDNVTAAKADDERAEALASFLDSANRANPGAVMKLNESPKVNIDVVPTGAISLDVAIGAGGFPRGKIVELYGGEGGGKCLVKGTYVWTDAGLETIEELFERCGQETTDATLVTDVTALDVRAVNEHGELEQVAALTHNSIRPTWRITVESGRSIEATANHPLRVLTDGGVIEWRNVGDIRPGDVLVSALFGAEIAAGASDLCEDQAILLGYLTAQDSSVGANEPARWDPETRDEYRRLLLADTGTEPSQSATATHATTGTRHGLDRDGHASTPRQIRTGGAKMQAAYLSALYSAAGSIEHTQIRLATRSRVLAEQVQLLLLGLGVEAMLRVGHDTTDDHWNVEIATSTTPRFLERIGLRSRRLTEQAATLAGETSAAKVENPSNHPYTFERVVAVDDTGRQPTFDLFVPGTSSFLANGIVSHNTTVALTVAANAQKLGGNVGFIDAEHGLNRQLCNNIGIDPDRFVVSQPDNGEEAIDMVEKMIRSKAFDVVIVDSVAAMTPKAEIESEIDQQFMGLHARLMSKFMRRVAGLANENGVMLILVNQIRKNLAAYGTPDETTGGKAIKFYASLRIEVRTSGSKKLTKGSETIGHTVVATVKKNRLGAPHTTAEFDLIYGKGLDGTGALLDVAEKVGVLSRSGAYYTDNTTGERLSETGADGKVRSIVGKEAAKELLRSDVQLNERLERAVYRALSAGTVSIDDIQNVSGGENPEEE